MRKINKEATKVFFALIKDLTDESPSTRFDAHDYWPDCDGGFMAVHVEKIMDIDDHPAYSIAHYFRQNGDLMADPEMTFLVHNEMVIPCSFTQHSMGIFREGIFWTEDGWKCRVSEQKDQAIFAGDWLKNIKHQQDIQVN